MKKARAGIPESLKQIAEIAKDSNAVHVTTTIGVGKDSCKNIIAGDFLSGMVSNIANLKYDVFGQVLYRAIWEGSDCANRKHGQPYDLVLSIPSAIKYSDYPEMKNLYTTLRSQIKEIIDSKKADTEDVTFVKILAKISDAFKVYKKHEDDITAQSNSEIDDFANKYVRSSSVQL